MRGIPVAASYHTDVPGFTARWGLKPLVPLAWAGMRAAHRGAALNLCPSRATAEELARQGFENLAVWGRGVDTERFHPCKRSPMWRARLSAGEPERPLLLYVGRLSPEKRVDWIADVLDALPEALAAIQKGTLTATIEQMPGGQSRGALNEMIAFLRDGTKPEPLVLLTPIAITKDNLDQAERLGEVK